MNSDKKKMKTKRKSIMIIVLLILLILSYVFIFSAFTIFVNDEMQSAINSYISKEEEEYMTGTAFTSTKILGSRLTMKGTLIYAWQDTTSYSKNGNAIDWHSSASNPCVLLVKKNAESYDIVSYDYPGDGSDYPIDLKKLFSPIIQLKIILFENNRKVQKLSEENLKKASKHYGVAYRGGKLEKMTVLSSSSDLEGVSIVPLSINTAGDLLLHVNWINESNSNLVFGEGYSLSCFDGEKWREKKLKRGYAFTEIALLLDKGQTIKHTYHLNAYLNSLDCEKYRLTADFYPSNSQTQDSTRHTVTVEFRIDDSMEEYTTILN